MSDMQWVKPKDKMNYRRKPLDTRLPRKDVIFMSRISHLIGHKVILNNNSKDLVRLRIFDLKTKAILGIHLRLFVSRHLTLQPLLNRAYTIKLSMISVSWLITMRSSSTEKFKKKKLLIKEISKGINNNKLADST